VDLFQDGAELGHVQTRGAGRLDAEIPAGDLAAECQALQIAALPDRQSKRLSVDSVESSRGYRFPRPSLLRGGPRRLLGSREKDKR
jgi:hypothetical protein